jgi:hypothetical protein
MLEVSLLVDTPAWAELHVKMSWQLRGSDSGSDRFDSRFSLLAATEL